MDGKRGCFMAHQRASKLAIESGANYALIFEDDVEFLPHFSSHAASRVLAFLSNPASPTWSIFFLGHFPRALLLLPRAAAVLCV